MDSGESGGSGVVCGCCAGSGSVVADVCVVWLMVVGGVGGWRRKSSIYIIMDFNYH
mgnify:CR=1 FL=1